MINVLTEFSKNFSNHYDKFRDKYQI